MSPNNAESERAVIGAGGEEFIPGARGFEPEGDGAVGFDVCAGFDYGAGGEGDAAAVDFGIFLGLGVGVLFFVEGGGGGVDADGEDVGFDDEEFVVVSDFDEGDEGGLCAGGGGRVDYVVCEEVDGEVGGVVVEGEDLVFWGGGVGAKVGWGPGKEAGEKFLCREALVEFWREGGRWGGAYPFQDAGSPRPLKASCRTQHSPRLSSH